MNNILMYQLNYSQNNIADCPSVLLVPLFHVTQCVSQPRKCKTNLNM
ncbi:hypothetical protein MtrunA17_Chr2g0310321 [Medicago truncatula]|uniref:Uncharacterized protein n=1 Tax=Medicago truncatula TaxID=3880 RepID=A0A396J851_MEDTR|nr:hypothetical protein MtrunA17_Chr2g0310321 [Medicago truncatula]